MKKSDMKDMFQSQEPVMGVVRRDLVAFLYGIVTDEDGMYVVFETGHQRPAGDRKLQCRKVVMINGKLAFQLNGWVYFTWEDWFFCSK